MKKTSAKVDYQADIAQLRYEVVVEQCRIWKERCQQLEDRVAGLERSIRMMYGRGGRRNERLVPRMRSVG